jgi:5'-deoxynucleotidase YfbR-like HD superfamily hydrolase
MVISSPRARVPNHIERPDAVLRMRSGRVLNLYDPSPLDVVPMDFVFGASRVARWGGQTNGERTLNVLQHCVIVRDIARDLVDSTAIGRSAARARSAFQAALHHDLHEGGGLGDIITPYGKLLNLSGGLLDEIKERLDRCLALQMGLVWPLRDDVAKVVKLADRAAAVSEAIQLMGYSEAQARASIGRGYAGLLYAKEIVPLGEAEARALWLEAASSAGLRVDGGFGGGIDRTAARGQAADV